MGGFGLNITNGEAPGLFADRGLAAATLSMELTFRQTAFAADQAPARRAAGVRTAAADADPQLPPPLGRPAPARVRRTPPAA